MKTKCRLWQNGSMVVMLLSTDGFLKGRRTMMVNVTIKKARLVVKMFSDKFKELTAMRLSHS